MKKYVLFILIVLSACDKTRNDHVNSVLKKAFDYEPGTYWIYKDSTSGQIDSFFVVKKTYASTELDRTENADVIYITIYDYNNGVMNKDSVIWQWTLMENSISIGYGPLGDSAAFKSFGYDPFIDYPYKIHALENDGINYDENAITDIIPSLLVGGQNFTNVVEINHVFDYSYSYNFYNDWFYFNNDAGIIKMRLDHAIDSSHKTWELQRYKIIY